MGHCIAFLVFLFLPRLVTHSGLLLRLLEALREALQLFDFLGPLPSSRGHLCEPFFLISFLLLGSMLRPLLLSAFALLGESSLVSA